MLDVIVIVDVLVMVRNLQELVNKTFDQTYLNKINVAKLFGSKCSLCGRKIALGTKRKINFTYHHFSYNPNEKIYKDFKNSKEYNEYILPIVIKNPKNFALLHRKCHYSVEMAKKYSDKKWKRLSHLRKKSI